MNHLAIWLTILAAVLCCYFAACNIILKTFSRKVIADVFQQRGRADVMPWLMTHRHSLILMTGTLRFVFVMIMLLAVLWIVETQLHQWTRIGQYAIALLAAGLLGSIFAVAIPVSWAMYKREQTLVWSLPILDVLLRVFTPLTWAMRLLDPVVRRISGAQEQEADENALTEHVLSVVEEHQDVTAVDEAQKEMLEAVFELPTTSAGEIMTPRTEVMGLDISSDLQSVKHSLIDFGHSRIPVYEGNLDHIVGMLYAKDMIRFVGDGEAFDLHAVLREAYMVPESKSVRELLADFKARKVHVAIVLDEYGGTAGLVSIEDILEEIVGDIQDEYELLEKPPSIETVDQATAEVDARVRIDDLNDTLNTQLPEDEDYDTVGGFVFATLGHIPEPGETFESHEMRFTVTDAERTKVKRVKVERLQSPQASENGS